MKSIKQQIIEAKKEKQKERKNCGLLITATTAEQDWLQNMIFLAIIHTIVGMKAKQLLYRQLLFVLTSLEDCMDMSHHRCIMSIKS